MTKESQLLDSLSSSLGLTKVFSKILLDRGLTDIKNIEKFLKPSLLNLPDPSNIPNIYEAAEFIYDAISKNKKFCVYGDYDLDGISSTALLTNFLEELGVDIISYIPDRVKDGYGLSKNTIDNIKKDSVDLIITVDCGITSVEEVAYAKGLGIDVIITDHHEAQKELPDTIIVDPKLKQEDNELLMLAGVGVAFYMLIAIRAVFREKNPEAKSLDIKKYLWLVAIGSIADIVPLVGVNRILVYYGIKQINMGKILAINVLAEKDGRIKLGSIDAGVISFLISPKLNAAGRIATPIPVLKLFLTKSIDEARSLVDTLDEYNKQRVEFQNTAIKTLQDEILNTEDLAGIPVFYNKELHQGIIGIVSARFSKKLERPVLVCASDGDDTLKCSFRSYNNINLLDIIEDLKTYLIAFGGHKSAAGFSCNKSDLDNIRSFLAKYDYKDKEMASDTSHYELEISDITKDLIMELELLEPFGNSNPKPTFSLKNTKLKNKRVLKDKHVKFKLENNLDVIGFNLYSEENFAKDDADLVFYLEFNVWNGIRKVQLNLLGME